MKQSIFKKLLFVMAILWITIASYGESIYTDKWSVYSLEGEMKLSGSATIHGYSASNADGMLADGSYPIEVGSAVKLDHISVATTDTSIVSVPKNKKDPVSIDTLDKKSSYSVKESWFDVKVPKYDTLPQKNDIVTGNWGSGAEIEYSGRYNKIDIGTQLTINLKNEDILIAVDEMSVTGAGKVVVNRTGKGNLHIVVLNSLNLAGDGQINKKNSSSEEYVNLYYLSSSNGLNISGNSTLDGSLYVESQSLDIGGSGVVTGKVITNGPSVTITGAGKSGSGATGNLYASRASVTISGSGKLSGGIVSGGEKVEISGGAAEIQYVYAPEADVELTGSASANGFVVCSNLLLSGAANIGNQDVPNETPDWTDIDDNEVDLSNISVLEITDTGVSDFNQTQAAKFKELTTLSMKQYVALRKEMEGLYDVVYMGTGTYSNQGLSNTARYSNADRTKAHATKGIMNDITELKAKEIENSFIKKNYLVILRSDIYKGKNLNQYFSKYKEGDLNNTKLVDDMDEIFVVMGRHTNLRPELNLIGYQNDRTYYQGDMFEIRYTSNVANAKTELYVDRNFNNVIDSNEQMDSGTNGVVSFEVPHIFSGITSWSLILEDSNGRRAIKTGYFTIIDTKVEVNVLQVMNSNRTGSLLSSNNMNQDYLNGNTIEKELNKGIDVYDINVTVVDINQFNIADKSSRDYIDLDNYNMVLFGFADSYGGTRGVLSDAGKEKLDKFINTGQSIMFTHDMMFESSPSWAGYRNLFAQTGVEHNLGSRAVASTTNTQKVNEGILTLYPFRLSTNIRVNTTHDQYFGLDMEDPEVIPWYNLVGSERDPYDSYNHYYTYSKGNFTYSGTGHTPQGFPDSEQRLFINTMFRAFIGANHPPIVEISEPTEETLILGEDKMKIEFKAYDMDWADGVIAVEVKLNGDTIQTMNIPNNGKKVSIETDKYKKGEINKVVVIATDERNAKGSDEVSVYVPDDKLVVNYTNPSGNYLQTNDGIIVEFEVESRYKKRKVTKNENGEKIYTLELDSLERPLFTISATGTSSYNTRDNSELVLTEEQVEADRVPVDEVEDLLVKKYKVKIQNDENDDSVYQKIKNGEKIKLRVDATSTDGNATGFKEKIVGVSEPKITEVTITNLTIKSLFESLLDENGNSLYKNSDSDLFYSETLLGSQINKKIDSNVYMKQGDKVEVKIVYTDESGSSVDDIKGNIQLSNLLLSEKVLTVDKQDKEVTAIYTLTFKNEFGSSERTKLELGLNVSDNNNGRADLQKISLGLILTPPTSEIALLKNGKEKKPDSKYFEYIGASDKYGYKITNDMNNSNIVAYLIAFGYDYSKSDLKTKPDPNTMNNYLYGNTYYFATKSVPGEKKLSSLINQKLDGEYRVSVIAVDKAGNYDTLNGKSLITSGNGALSGVNLGSNNLIFYVDSIAPDIISNQLIKTREGTNEKLLESFKFNNGVIDKDYFKNEDIVETFINASEFNYDSFSYSIGDVITKNQGSSEETQDGKIVTIVDSGYTVKKDTSSLKIILSDKAGNVSEKTLTGNYSDDVPGGLVIKSDFTSGNIKFTKLLDLVEQENVVVAIAQGSSLAKGNNINNISRFGISLSDGYKKDYEIKSFTSSGAMTVSKDNFVVDKNINYSGLLESTVSYDRGGQYIVNLDFKPVTEYVGLKSFKLYSTSGINSVNGSNVVDKNEHDLNPSKNPSTVLVKSTYGSPAKIGFTHNKTDPMIIKIYLIDKLGNDRLFDYKVNIKYNTEIIGKKEGSNKKITSKIDIGSTGNIDIRSRE